MRRHSTAMIDAAAVLSARPAAGWADWAELTKPRLNFMVVVTTMVGFYLAARTAGAPVAWGAMALTLIGTFLTAGAASTFNQVMEKPLDRLMPRTRNRPLPDGRLTEREAVVFGLILLTVGLGLLAMVANGLTVLLGAMTVGCYLFLYTPMKRRSTLNTVIGAVPGAIPPVMGWAACRGSIGAEAMALFAILFLWQMPHFLAIAILYRRDYAAAGFKMLPVVDEAGFITGRQIVAYTLALVSASLLPTAMGLAGPVYFAVAGGMGMVFLGFGLSWSVKRTRVAARNLFLCSIVYLPVVLGVMCTGK